MSSFECNTVDKLRLQKHKCLFAGRLPASLMRTGAGGKPSIWFPPEGLVELAADISRAFLEFLKIVLHFLKVFMNIVNEHGWISVLRAENDTK